MRTILMVLALTAIAEAAPPTIADPIATAAQALRERLVACRRDLHMHPELSNREERTAKIVAERLRALGLEDVRTGVGKHGVTALLRGKKPGPVVAVRADMDALQIQETNNVPYKSQTPGVKHACGHDLHVSVGLGVAEVLASLRETLPGTVKFIFQGAEESPPEGEEGGAKMMVKERALEAPRPSVIFGLHAWPLLEAGKVAWVAGPTLASADKFVIKVRGKKTHGAAPHLGVDAVTVAAECVSALQTIRSRRIDTLDPMVLSIGMVHGGNRFNIIADEVLLEGTVRTLSEPVRVKVRGLMKDILAGVTAAHGATYEMRYEESAAMTVNDPGLVEASLPALRRALGDANVIAAKPVLGAEDFAYFSRVIPGFYFFLGVGNAARGITAMIHTPDFDLDEAALVHGVNAMSRVVLDHLSRPAGAR